VQTHQRLKYILKLKHILRPLKNKKATQKNKINLTYRMKKNHAFTFILVHWCTDVNLSMVKLICYFNSINYGACCNAQIIHKCRIKNILIKLINYLLQIIIICNKDLNF